MALQDAGAPFAFGVVANISAGGACIWTNALLEPGRSVAMQLSFPRGTQLLEAEGVVVWGQVEDEAEGVRYGLQWSAQTAGRNEYLARMISASA